MSGLSGQLGVHNGVEQLVLSHALVASIDFPGLAAAGTYIDKLTYQRISAASEESPAPAPIEDPAVRSVDPLVGSWFAIDGTALLISSVVPYPGDAFGWVMGRLVCNGGSTLLYGVTDINAQSGGLQRQSVSIVGLPGGASGPAISLSGTLDLRSGILSLLNLRSQSTLPGNGYLQTLVSSLEFSRR